MCGGGTQSTTNFTAADPRVSANYDYITGRAKANADIPFQYYPGSLVAGIPSQMQSGFDIINNTQGVAAPFISQAAQYAQQGAAPISAQAIGSYLNPYQSDVINATMANMRESDAQAQQGVIGNAISKGAWGGDRAGVAQAELARQQALARNQTFAGLNSQNYSQALAAAQQDAARQSQAAYTMGALGQEAQSTALTGANAQIGAGQLQQQQGQNEINSAYNQWAQARSYPFNTTQWLAGILGGQAGQMGGTSSTTSPAPGVLQQAVGAGAGIAGILGATGAFGSSGWLWSDERLKENIVPIGRAFDGQMIYRYNFKGDPKTQIGFLAQEVERRHPEAVREFDGIKGVDYHEATDDAADRGGFATGGIPSMRSPIIPDMGSYTPDVESPAAGPLVAQGYELKSITKPAYEQVTRGGFDGGGVVPYGDGGPFPQLGLVNGMPVPLAASAAPAFGVMPAMGAGRSRMPSAPRPGPVSDIGTDVVRLAQMLRSSGFGRRSTGQPGGYGTVGDLISAQGLRARGGRAPRADGGSGDAGVQRYVSLPMPTAPAQDIEAELSQIRQDMAPNFSPDQIEAAVRFRRARLQAAGMAPPESIPLPFPADYSRLEPVDAPSGIVPITAALDSLRSRSAPSGVVAAPAAAPAPIVVADAAPRAGRAFPSEYAARIARTESPNAADNPDTGAGTEYQFLPSTALYLAQSTPWGRGLSAPQVMAAIKADGAKRDELLARYNQYSTAALTRAGLPVNDTNMFALHAFGPAGGVSLLRADPNTPVADWVRSVNWGNATPEQVIAQNGLGKYRTVGDLLKGYIADRIGGPAPQGVVAGRGAPAASPSVGVAPQVDDSGDDAGDGGDSGVEGDSAPPDDSGDSTPAPSGVVAAPAADSGAGGGSGSSMEKFFSSLWLALAATGFGMAGSRNPRFFGALGEGGLQGVQVAQAQLKNARELEALKANQAYRNAQLGLSREHSERQARQLDEQMRMHRQTEADRSRRQAQLDARTSQAEADRLRIIELREGREAREAEEKRLALAKPKMIKDTDPYTGKNLWQNGSGDLFIMGDDGKFKPYTGVQSGAQSTGYQHDPAKERTVTLSSGDLTIPPLDPRDLTLSKDTIKETVKHTSDLKKAGAAAGDVQRKLDALKAAYAKLPAAGPGAPGPWADAWRAVAGQANALATSLGVAPAFDPNVVGGMEAMRKQTIELAAAATKAFNGNRPTNFDLETMLKATPGAQLTPQAFQQIVSVMEATNARARDKAKYLTEYERHRRTPVGGEEAFDQQRPDDFYTKQAGINAPQRAGAGAPGTSAANPIDVATPAEAGKLPKGTFIRDPYGKIRQVP